MAGGANYKATRGRGRGRGVRDTLRPNLPTPSTPPSTLPAPPESAVPMEDASLSPLHESDTPLEAGASYQDSTNQQRGPRGSYLLNNIPANPSERQVIHISGKKFLDKDVPRNITKIFKGNFSGKHSQWRMFSKDLEEHLYKCFLDRYQFDETVNPETARLVWLDKAKELCRGTWIGIRKQCKKETKSDNPADWKQCCPKFIYQDDWEGILESWMTPEWRKRSTAGTENRKRVPGVEEDSFMYVTHTGGSVNFEIHRQKLIIELGRDPTELEVFERVHKRNKGKGEWCDAKAKKVVITYHNTIKEKNVSEMEMDNDQIVDDAEPPTEVSFDSEAWTNAIGVPKKKNAYGHSQASSSLSKDSIVHTPTIPVISEEDVIQLKEDNARLQGVVETCMRRMEEIQKQLDGQKNTDAASE